MRYRKKPVEVDAWQVGSDEPMPDWVLSVHSAPEYNYGAVCVVVFDGAHIAFDGDWVVSDDSASWIVNAREFEQTYEVVE